MVGWYRKNGEILCYSDFVKASVRIITICLETSSLGWLLKSIFEYPLDFSRIKVSYWDTKKSNTWNGLTEPISGVQKNEDLDFKF